jgi:hypothetical protein
VRRHTLLFLLYVSGCAAAPSPPTPAALHATSWGERVAEGLSVARRQPRPALGGGWSLRNDPSGLTGVLSASGLEVRPRTGPALQLQLVSWGRPSAGSTMVEAPPRLGACSPRHELDASGACLRQLVLDHGAVEETWESGPEALQHAFRVSCFRDADQDGVTADAAATTLSVDGDCTDAGEASLLSAPVDCDDTNAGARPGGAEVAGNLVDEDCDGRLLCRLDGDHDGYAIEAVILSEDLDCADAGEAEQVTELDCDDTLPEVRPGAEELPANGQDDDCDGLVGCGPDADRDGYAAQEGAMVEASACPVGTVALSLGVDCDDVDNDIFPGAIDLPDNGVDEDCSGSDATSAVADPEDEGGGGGCAFASGGRVPAGAALLLALAGSRRRRGLHGRPV